MFDDLTRNYLNTVLRKPLLSLFRLVRAMNFDLDEHCRESLVNAVLSLPERDAKRFIAEMAYVSGCARGVLPCFPYERIKPGMSQLEKGCVGSLPFVLHCGKRLFHHKNWDPEVMYRGLVDDEGILGDGCRAKSPHAYVDESFKVEEGDVVLDIGAAEGLFSLDCVERAQAVYLFECDKRWASPLAETFRPWSYKVHIVNKFVSGRTGGHEIRLCDAVGEKRKCCYFLKMDIEGGERDVLLASQEFLLKNDVKIACCVYHRQDDADVIEKLLREMGFQTKFSDGWMLPMINGARYPYFRHGVIRAWKRAVGML